MGSGPSKPSSKPLQLIHQLPSAAKSSQWRESAAAYGAQQQTPSADSDLLVQIRGSSSAGASGSRSSGKQHGGRRGTDQLAQPTAGSSCAQHLAASQPSLDNLLYKVSA